jgi:predicted HTH transcriptional regulator
MTPFSVDQLNNLKMLGHEHPGVEYKKSGKLSEKGFAAKVIRAMLALSNRRDGGIIVIGVEDLHERVEWKGMENDDVTTWTYDNLVDKVALYADPSVSFELDKVPDDDENYIIISIKEFVETPIFCKKDVLVNNDQILREGALYIRPRHRAQVREISTAEDMRDLIDLAVQKEIRDFAKKAICAGLLPAGPDLETSEDLFRKERDSI